jgi:tetratricopeptide (TPR) repeat protein
MEKWEEYAAEVLQAIDDENYTEGIKYATMCIDAGCKEIKIYSLRGYCYLESGNHQAAIEDFNRYIKKVKNDYLVIVFRGMCYLNIGEHKKALKDFDIGVKNMPDDKDAYFNRGVCLSYLREHRRAIADLDKSEKLGCKEALIWRQRGFCNFSLQNNKEAKKDILHYTTLINTDAYCFYILSKIEEAKEDWHEAIKYVSQAIYLDGENTDYYIDRMHLYNKTDQREKADADFIRANDTDPTKIGFMIGGKFKSLADIRKERGDHAEADDQ